MVLVLSCSIKILKTDKGIPFRTLQNRMETVKYVDYDPPENPIDCY